MNFITKNILKQFSKIQEASASLDIYYQKVLTTRFIMKKYIFKKANFA